MARSNQPAAKGAADFLRSHDKMAALMPALMRLTALQKACSKALPTIFDKCAVIQFEAGQLVLSTPNAAIAAKLKQQLPKLQETLLRQGWQVDAIRLKVQLAKPVEAPPKTKELVLPEKALSALAVLESELDDTPHNKALKAAIAAMRARHAKGK